jgi:predicted nuclease of predicted toxin-antitoxin system
LRFLIDNALSPLVAARLRDAGHDEVHVRDFDLQAETDEDVFARATAERRALASTDTDFAPCSRCGRRTDRSVVLFRHGAQRRPEDQVALLLANLAAVEADLEAGCVVVLEPERIRVRRLPIGSD